jgi:DNA-binding MarR family transcriptional regulator
MFYGVISPLYGMDNDMPDSANITKTEYEVLAEFRYTLRRFLHFSENAAEKIGVTPQQHQALLTIMGYPGREKITIGELAERLQIRHHSAVGLVNRLCAENLIERTPAQNDRRQVFISLTEHGVSVIEQLSKIHREELGLLAPHLRSLLEKIIKFYESRN